MHTLSCYSNICGRILILCSVLLLASLVSEAQIGADQRWLDCQQAAKAGDWAGAAAGWQKLLAQTDWPYHHMRDEAELSLAVAERHLGRFAQAKDRLAGLLARHAYDDYTPRLVAQQALLPGEEPSAAIERGYAFLLDAHFLPVGHVLDVYEAALRAELGDGKPMLAALAHYLATHAGHPALLPLRLRLACGTLAAGEREAGVQQLMLLQNEAVGTPEELQVLLSLSTTLLQDGHAGKAVACLAPYAAFNPGNTELTQRLLAAYRQAGDAEHYGQIIDRLLKHQPDIEDFFEPASWLFTAAVAAHDKLRAQHWLDILDTIAPEHPFAVKARKVMKDWVAAPKP